MLIRRAVLDAIVTGEVSLAFRRWERPRVVEGTRVRTAVGVLEVVGIEEVRPDAVTVEDARAAGSATVEAAVAGPADRPLFRIELRHVGADPRVHLRETVPDDAELAEIREQLDGIDARSRRGPWTQMALDLIARRPATVARDLAAGAGREERAFKRDVRLLKELGLTESLEVGYRLSPRGEAVHRTLVTPITPDD